ncbi:alkyl hydroperoxide reductase subunit F [Puniceicoccaceae bacterium K14]|nr:alkyl hydroperoxide reductase subunit F [Puniceicoccaceae bacterium K14]
MKLSPEIVKALEGYFKSLQRKVSLKLFAGEHAKRPELLDLLTNVSKISNNVELIHSATEFNVREGLTFEVLAEEESTGIRFSGVPGGHEFNTFVLAILNAGGHPVKLDDGIQRQVKAIDTSLSFEVFVSLDCHNCPDVVQILNQFSIVNPNISCEMVEGATHKAYAEKMNVQGVPTVLLNHKPFSSGKISASEILEKIGDFVDLAPVEATLDETLYDVSIVGGGPAAAAAAVYTARKGLKVLMLAEKIGGQVAETMAIENLISVKHTTGPALTRSLREHVESYGVTIREEVRVTSVERKTDSEEWLLSLNTSETIQSRTVVIATGAKWRELGVPGEKENIGKGVAYCPHCDGPFFKGKDVIVVGGGNSGVEAALDLSGIVKSVTVVEFMDTLKADQVLVDKLEKTQNAKIITGTATESIEADSKGVKAIKLKERTSNEVRELATDGVFVQIGLAPNSGFIKELVTVNRYGEIEVNPRCETNQSGIFACGDVTTVPFKQIVVSIGEGAKAGLSAFEYLLKVSKN